MVEDYQTRTILVGDCLTNMLLRELKEQLLLHGKHIRHYDLPAITFDTTKNDGLPTTILEELSIQIPNEDIQFVQKLNNDQMIVFNTIMNVINQKQREIFFVDGLGGTGKTFLYRAIMAVLRSRGEIVLATTSSGIAATLLPGGRTAHSRFGIPFDIEPRSFCRIGKNSDLAKLIRRTTAIICDEAPMINIYCLEALDKSLQDIMSYNAPFGGKVMIMGGDFRQVLPVIEKGNRAQMISASIVRSHLWSSTKILHMRQNMRSMHDHEFPEFLMRIEDGNEPTKSDNMVRVPDEIVIPWEGKNSIQNLIEHTFPQLQNHAWDASYMVERAIITPKNYDVQRLNGIIIDQFHGEEHNLMSFGDSMYILII